jgi:Adenylate and Guanylate cyclase catalytic domain
MEERGNKTIMCSVLFLDIVEYSKKSVAGQISLKDRFNSYLSSAIRDVPMTDRIILDTGDGAAINFLGDVEDALKAALSLRESLLNERPDVEHPLLVRMGINLGPVRLVRDINGQPNIVGDGINVAQRVMGFADAAQILVSRSYYDAVSRLSPQYAGMFHYQGSRTDKHVREHEVYAIGYPGDKTTRRGTTIPMVSEQAENTRAGAMQRAKAVWRSAATRLDALMGFMIIRFRQAESGQRVLYVIAVAVPLLLLIALLTNLPRHDEVPAMPTGMGEQAAITTQPGLTVAPVTSVPAGSEIKANGAIPAHSPTIAKPGIKKNVESKIAKEILRDKPKDKPQDKLEDKSKSKHSENQAKIINKDDAENNAAVATSSGSADAYISVTCMEGTEVFVDGIRKGRVGYSPLTVVISPGKHMVIVSHTSRGIFTQSVELNSGKTVHIKPSLCN